MNRCALRCHLVGQRVLEWIDTLQMASFLKTEPTLGWFLKLYHVLISLQKSTTRKAAIIQITGNVFSPTLSFIFHDSDPDLTSLIIGMINWTHDSWERQGIQYSERRSGIRERQSLGYSPGAGFHKSIPRYWLSFRELMLSSTRVVSTKYRDQPLWDVNSVFVIFVFYLRSDIHSQLIAAFSRLPSEASLVS